MKQTSIDIIQINKNRFDIFMLFTRKPMINLIAKELEYYANPEATILGLILFDYTDKDYNFIILARDENRQFRSFKIQTDFESIELARERLVYVMKYYTNNLPELEAPSNANKGIQLFNIIVSKDKLHPYFIHLNKDNQFIPSKKALIEVANHFNDIDGNFVEQFQTINGFDARVWEIYLFAFLIEQNFEIERVYESPDFIIKKDNFRIAIEATIVARKKNNPPSYFNEKQKEISIIEKELENNAQLRFGSALYSKLMKKYWKLPHLENTPIFIAIADFHDTSSMTWSFPALIEYLYGDKPIINQEEDGGVKVVKIEKAKPYTKENGQKIESGFFLQEFSENISGVIFSTTGTLSKFTRMGIQAGFGVKTQLVIRFGDCYNEENNATKSSPFYYAVNENCKETWSEGINIFHNPNAKYPVPIELFENVANHKYIDGALHSWFPDFHPIASVNINTVIKE